MTGAKEVDTDVRPKYYEVYGEQIAMGTRHGCWRFQWLRLLS